MMFSGIVLHKRTLSIHTLDEDGELVRQANLAATQGTLRACLATLPGPHRAVVECTGMWYWVRDLLVAQGVDLRLGQAKYLKAISYAKVKTDPVDAATLAQLLRVGLIPEARRFPTVRQFHSYCRLVPGASDSAATRRHKRSRDGNGYLKVAFHHADIRVVQYFPELGGTH
jgi:transposase